MYILKIKVQTLGNILCVGVGGFVGSAVRYAVSLGIRGLGWEGKWPLATLTVNVLGAILVSVLWGRTTHLPQVSPLFLLGIVGFCGGFTTFSAFSFEVAQWLRAGEYGWGLLYAGASVVLCVWGTFLGLTLTK